MEGLDGTFAEYFVLANHLIHVVPDSLPTEKAIFVEPLAAALEIPNQLHIKPQDNVAIIGDEKHLCRCSPVRPKLLRGK